MTLLTKFYHAIPMLLSMRSCDQSLVTLAFLWEKLLHPQFYRDLARKTPFSWEVVSAQFQKCGTGTRYKLEILQQCEKKVKTKSQIVLEAKSYVSRTYMGKTGRRDLPPPLTRTPLLNRVKGLQVSDNANILHYIKEFF